MIAAASRAAAEWLEDQFLIKRAALRFFIRPHPPDTAEAFFTVKNDDPDQEMWPVAASWPQPRRGDWL